MCTITYADDLVIVAEHREEIQSILVEWKTTAEMGGLSEETLRSTKGR